MHSILDYIVVDYSFDLDLAVFESDCDDGTEVRTIVFITTATLRFQISASLSSTGLAAGKCQGSRHWCIVEVWNLLSRSQLKSQQIIK